MAEANYSLDNLPERAAVARLLHKDYIAEKEAHYSVRKRYRETQRYPVLAFVGMGRAGKDTAAEYVCKQSNAWGYSGSLVYPQSASYVILPLVAEMIGISQEQAYAERHAHREFWINACHAIRGDDYAMLVRMCLGAGDVVVGIRGLVEFQCVVQKRIVDWTIWIENPRVPRDITVEFAFSDCDLTIPNAGSLEEFHSKLDKVIPALFAKKRW